MSTIDYADVQVGDEIEIATTTRERKIVAYKSATWIGVNFEGGGGVPFRSTEGKERVFTLISRPEPPKPAAKVGEVFSDKSPEPPIHSIIQMVTRQGTVWVRKPDGLWYVTAKDVEDFKTFSGAKWGPRPYGDWEGKYVAPSAFRLIHLPSE